METSQYQELFLSESQEILTALNKAMVRLEKNSKDEENLNAIFRYCHTLKGMAATMGYERMVRLAHVMENILSVVRQGKIAIEKSMIHSLFEGLDMLESLLEEIRKGKEKNINEGPLVERLEKVVSRESSGRLKTSPPSRLTTHDYQGTEKRMLRIEDEDRPKILAGMKKGILPYRVTLSLSKESSMREARAIVALKTMEEFGEIVRSSYIANQIKEGRFGRHFGFFFLTKKKPEEIEKKIIAIPEIEQIRFKPLEENEVMVVPELSQNDSPSARSPSKKSESIVQSIRVNLDRLESLMNTVGELSINKIRLAELSRHLGDKNLAEVVTQTEQIVSRLQDEAMQIRLLPLEYLLSRFPRMIRDISHQEEKEVELVVTGSDIGVDRTVLDEINDPLIHILRNAVSHGIERPEERKKTGKPVEGRIEIVARQERNFVILDIRDDGRGMDKEKIRELALQKKLITSEEAPSLSEEEIFMLVTLPAFSMSKEITEHAGRGVGMNVARSKVEAIGGSLSIQSQLGKGSTITLRLPLTMAIIHAMLVELADQTCAIPLSNITETIKVNTALLKKLEHQEIIPYREGVLPLVRLREKLGFTRDEASVVRANHVSERPSSIGHLPIVVCEIGHKKVGLVVDRFIGEQEVVIKNLSGSLRGIRGFSGATILGSGRVAMILDVGALI